MATQPPVELVLYVSPSSIACAKAQRVMEHILRAYDLHANCYVTKPVDLKAFQAIVHALEGFWFTVVKLPPRQG